MYEAGIPFRVRRANLLRDMQSMSDVKEPLNCNRTMNVADEVLARNDEMAKNDKAEAERDRTFDEFKELYEAHIEGKIPAETRTKDRPVTAAEGEDGKPAMRKTGMSEKDSIAPSEKMSRSSAHRSAIGSADS